MIAEEIGLNDHLEANGIEPVETDLGEYIFQLRRETPSHIIAPAIHVTTEGVAKAFREHHTDMEPDRPLPEPSAMLADADLKCTPSKPSHLCAYRRPSSARQQK